MNDERISFRAKTPEQRERWQEAADQLEVSLTKFLQQAADKRASEVLDSKTGGVVGRLEPYPRILMTIGPKPLDGNALLIGFMHELQERFQCAVLWRNSPEPSVSFFDVVVEPRVQLEIHKQLAEFANHGE